MDTKFTFSVTTYFLLKVVFGTVYIKSREESSWSSAREYCLEFGGHLATLNNFQEFRTSVQTKQTTLAPSEELWVGASLQKSQWKWKGEDAGEFKAGGQFYTRRGCLQHDLPDNGTLVEKLTPEKCLNLCHWQGVVGLQNDRCYCHSELNVSSSRPGVCHIKCDPSRVEMCGGYSSVSLYKPGKRRISWADGEPKVEYNCVFLRKGGRDSGVQFVSGNCDMQVRFLCSFYDNDKCGIYDTCIRWSTTQATWDNAIHSCAELNGTLAELSRSDKDYISRDLDRLPPGTFWVALRRDSGWQWINGHTVNPSLFHSGTSAVPDRTCAVVRNNDGNFGLVGRRCDTKKYYLCQYDYMRKRGNMDALVDPSTPQSRDKTTIPGSDSTSRTPLPARDSDDGITVLDTNNETVSPEQSSTKGGIYMVLGFVSGMVCVLIIGLIVYLICRCKEPKAGKHARLSDQPSSRHDNHSVHYSSKDDSIQISPPHSDITYDTVYDLETESPFRRTHRLIRMGSANSWRHAQSRRMPTDTTDSPEAGYTWRGMIGGDVEIINTELRHQGIDQSAASSSYDGAASYGSARAIVEHHDARRTNNQHDFDEIEVLYDLPERSNSFDFEKSKCRGGKNPKIPTDPRFLEIRTSRNSDSNEENIYATIKKTFQKIKDEMAEQSQKSTGNDEDFDKMTYTAKLN
ncbi:uncharacterized protein LOC123559774 isoform X2 [Mercenaria mercenaria]|uniref:uncharacterized protein LOC123559774 isoform X2 n=1 Tax=Mercenaria mercenaria TaxID=6596 RepID=UPI00234F4410|nr:uncharacterized protein LOC123559774 isoform X2 [Mercenaria mercenaria]